MKPGSELVHLLSDAATMKLVVWTDGGFGMAAHNYDGDVLTDELAQVHKSPGFITSNLVGVDAAGTLIKEFEASHGTVTDMDEARIRGEETSLNPLGMVEGLIGAMNHAADVHGGAEAYTRGRASSAARSTSCSGRDGARATSAARAGSPPSSSSTPSRRSCDLPRGIVVV